MDQNAFDLVEEQFVRRYGYEPFAINHAFIGNREFETITVQQAVDQNPCRNRQQNHAANPEHIFLEQQCDPRRSEKHRPSYWANQHNPMPMGRVDDLFAFGQALLDVFH